MQLPWCLDDLLPSILGNRNVVLQEASRSCRDSGGGIKSRRCNISHYGLEAGVRSWIRLDHEDMRVSDSGTSCHRQSVHQVPNPSFPQASQAYGFHHAVDGTNLCFAHDCTGLTRSSSSIYWLTVRNSEFLPLLFGTFHSLHLHHPRSHR